MRFISMNAGRNQYLRLRLAVQSIRHSDIPQVLTLRAFAVGANLGQIGSLLMPLLQLRYHF